MPVAQMPNRTAGSKDGREFVVSNFREFRKNTLEAFLSLELPSGLILHGCTLHSKGDSRWVGLPSKPFKREDGTDGWAPVIEFVDKPSRTRFNTAAIRAVDAFLSGARR